MEQDENLNKKTDEPKKPQTPVIVTKPGGIESGTKLRLFEEYLPNKRKRI
jgi:hypothetical protein